ncbi:MAG: hypothetical protein ACLGQX_04935 [Acidobacteriota bacterium]
MTRTNRCLLLALTLSTVSTLAFAQAGDQEGAAPGYPATPTTQYPYQQPAPIQQPATTQQPAPIQRTTGGQQYPQQYQQYPQQYQQPNQQYPQPNQQYQQQYQQPNQQYQQPAPIQRTTGGQQNQQQYPQQNQQYPQQYPQNQQYPQQYQQQYPQQNQQQYPQQNQQPAPTQGARGAKQKANPDYQNHFISQVTAGQVIAPAHGTASAVPATGVFLRVAQGASVRVDEINDTEMKLDVTRGVANVAVHNSVKRAELLVDLPGGETAMVKDGFYTFNASTDTMRVLKGEAYGYPGDHMSRKPIKVKEKHAIYYNGPESKVFEFDPSEVVGDLVPFGPPQGASMGSGGFDDGYGDQAYGTGVPYDWYLNAEPYWWSYPYWWDPGWDWGFGLGWGWGWGGWGGWGGYGWGRWGYGGWGRYGGYGRWGGYGGRGYGGWGGHPGGFGGGGFHGGGGVAAGHGGAR